jgi:hypothetical protein
VSVIIYPNTPWPNWKAGETYEIDGYHKKGRIDLYAEDDNVTILFRPDSVFDGGRTKKADGNYSGIGNALYSRGASRTKLVGMTGGPRPQIINFVKSILYFSSTPPDIPVEVENLYLGKSGSDGSPADSEAGPQDHAIYHDGGRGIWRKCHFDRLTGCAGHPYSGSGRPTHIHAIDCEMSFCGFDGMHCGNASGEIIGEGLLLHDNGGYGWNNYHDNGVPNQFKSGYVWNNKGGAIRKKGGASGDNELVVGSGVKLTAPPTAPTPPPEPPVVPPTEPLPPDPCEAVKAELERVRIVANTYAGSLAKIAVESDKLEAEIDGLRQKGLI